MTTYPLRDNTDNDLQASSGRPLIDISSDGIRDNTLSADDLRIHADTLRKQAQIAKDAGYSQLAGNFLRAAELTLVPNEEVLKIYEMLRPDRASHDELLRLANYLETTYQATENAAFIREAANVYQQRNILRR